MECYEAHKYNDEYKKQILDIYYKLLNVIQETEDKNKHLYDGPSFSSIIVTQALLLELANTLQYLNEGNKKLLTQVINDTISIMLITYLGSKIEDTNNGNIEENNTDKKEKEEDNDE